MSAATRPPGLRERVLDLTPGLRRLLRDVSRTVARRRGLLAAGLAAGAVATALPVLSPPPVPGVTVTGAAHDLAAGHRLTDDDLTPIRLPTAVVPDGALGPATPVRGRLLAGAVRRGEAITDVRLVGPGLLAGAGNSGLVAAAVRLADPAASALLSAGNRIDVLAATAGAAGGGAARQVGGAPVARVSPDQPDTVARVLAADVLVLAVPPGADVGGDGALVLVAVDPLTAARLAGASLGSQLSAVVRSG